MSEWTAETAEWYAEKYGEYATNRLGIEQIDFPSDCTLGDVGCGTGAALRHASTKMSGGRLIGIDPISRMVELAREHTKGHPAEDRIEYFEGPAKALPLEDNLADIVIAFDSFDHWGDQLNGLSEGKRVMKPLGQFIVVKDGGLPHKSKAEKTFLSFIEQSGLKIIESKNITEADVTFKLWVCIYNSASDSGD